MKTARILFVCLIFSVLYFLFVATPALAQTPNPYTAPNTNPDVPNNLHNYTQNVMIEVMSALSCQLTGIDPTNPKQECLGVDQKTGKIGFVQSGGGAVGVMGNLIAMTFTPPINTADYFKNLAQNFGVTKNAYAANNGVGFGGISPLLDIWSAFRNIVYLLFVLVFVIVGVAIMLRVRIDPRTVMTIQNQIPKIIVGILLVTFSFAIAGFLIDLMYTSIYLVGNAVVSTDSNIRDHSLVRNIAKSTNPFSAANNIGGATGNTGGLSNIAWDPAKGLASAIAPLFDNKVGAVLIGTVTFLITKTVVKPATNIAGKVINAGLKLFGGALTLFGFPEVGIPVIAISSSITSLISNIVGLGAGIVALTHAKEMASLFLSIIAFIIIVVALLWALIRLWFTLISAYIFILLDVVFAPFWIVAGLFPGSSINFSAWIRDIVANLAAFPATIVLFLLARVFIDAFGSTQTTGQFVPPLIVNPSDTNAIGAIIGLGMILMTPNIVNMLRKALKTPQVDFSTAGAAIGVGVGTPRRLIGGGINTAVSPHYGVPPGAPPGTPPQLLYPQSSLGRFLRGFGIAK